MNGIGVIALENKSEVVDSFQLSTLFFIFLTGSSIINIPSPLIAAARNGAWLSLIISGTAGFILLSGLLYLFRTSSGQDFIDISNELLGKWATFIIGAALPLPFMLNMGTGIIQDVGLFMTSSMMRETPHYIFTSSIALVAALTALSGIEVIARMFTLILSTMVMFILIVLLLSIPDLEIGNLFPVMPLGIKPVLLGAYSTFGFPYAEIFLFTMLFPFVRKDQSKILPRKMYLALGLNIMVLIATTVCTILVFGPMAGERKYSMFEVARTIEVQEIIQRIESVIGMSLIAGSYMKTTITLYVNALFISKLFKVENVSLLIPPLALIYTLMSLVSFKGDTWWVETVSAILPLWSVFAFALPTLLIAAVSSLRTLPHRK